VNTLVLSIGNTSLLGGVFSGEKRRQSFRVPVGAATKAGVVAAKVRGGVDRVAVCSVVPALTPKIVARVRRRFAVEPQVLTAGRAHGLKIGYRRPRELGTDRIAAALGARKLFPGRNLIVVDCGTATTVTALRRDGTLLGGAIFPGLALWPAMLASRTAQLPEVPLGRPQAALGRSTREALQSGFFHGHAGAIRELARRIRVEAFGRAKVVVVGTGGNAARFSAEGIFDEVEPELVLVGLNHFSALATARRL
jgi:type III pantothenate kinase